MDNYDIACVLLDTGCRYNEIARITWDQVDRTKTDNESRMFNTQRVKVMMERRRLICLMA
jgi:integrase